MKPNKMALVLKSISAVDYQLVIDCGAECERDFFPMQQVLTLLPMMLKTTTHLF